MTGSEKAHVSVKDALDHARDAAQELHGALTDAVTQRGGALKGHIEALSARARALGESVALSLENQGAQSKHAVAEAIGYLEATGTHLTEALENTGDTAEGLLQHAIADLRTALQKLSEAIAARRSAAHATTLAE